ncbi:MAG TPA: 5-oxoprolinase subunit PxpB [Chthoniobacterales bacterium]|jgi:inhibitor of KinA|nr:5-oxoprolinase subunit PxpB [Chthoniobacterales bacterium]
MEITPLGDCAVLVRLTGNFEADPESALEKVLTAQKTLAAAKIPGVIELAPAYTTVALFYDPIRAIEAGAPVEDIFSWFEQRIGDAISNAKNASAHSIPSTTVEIPVCYASEFAFDLDDVARRTDLEPNEVIALHSSTEYRVHCVGFTPGFPFLGGLPPKLAAPRRETPRTEIPAGSVGIGGKQTGIYPVKSPGGWNIIGRTPLRLFDPQRNPPVLVRAGDGVRFRPISREEFDQLAKS